MSREQIALQTLIDSDIGTGLDEAALSDLFALAQIVEFPRGEEIVRQLAVAEAVFLPCSGMIMVERSALNGRRQVIGFLQRGNYLGFTATANYLYSAHSLEQCTLLRFQRSKFLALGDHYPQLKENLARINNRVLASLLDHLFAIGQKRAHERLAFLIHQLHARQTQRDANSLVKLPMNRTDIGDYLGLTLETTSRAFSRLRKDGVITTPDHHSVVIADLGRLATLADVD